MFIKSKKTRASAAVLAIILVITAAGCSFIGQKDEDEAGSENKFVHEDNFTYESGEEEPTDSFIEPIIEDTDKKSEAQSEEAEVYAEFKRYPTIESLFEDIGDMYSLYPKEDYEYAAYSFVRPDEYRKELGEGKYEALKAADITDYYFTYAIDGQGVCRIYISVDTNGTTFGQLMSGWSTHEVYVGEKGSYVDCYGSQSCYGAPSEAADALAEYIAYTGTYKFPEDGISNMSGLCGYIISRLEAKGEPATAEAIRAYAEKCFGMSEIVLTDDLIFNDADGTYSFAGNSGIEIPHYIVGEYASPYSPVNLSVWYYTDFSRYLASHLYDYKMKKSDGDWIFTSSTMAVYSPYEPVVYAN